jgi:hypothetical protein
VAAVQPTFTNKQYTEYREQNTYNNNKIHKYNNKNINKFWKCGGCHIFAFYTLSFSLQLKKKQVKTTVSVAMRTSQADTVQYTEEKE